ncbi:MAG: hypothetical protein DWQ02_07530 [Bacteroidetes bacterium]|nr:MAG: hypothetical protein DWQ02_07530 [Bacteroidota bacterium]
MALSKKKSRLITVGDIQYRWLVSTNSGKNVFVAEQEGVKGCRMEAYFDRYKNKFAGPGLLKSKDNLVIIKPGDTASIILQALDHGWTPEAKGKPVVFDLKAGLLIPR